MKLDLQAWQQTRTTFKTLMALAGHLTILVLQLLQLANQRLVLVKLASMRHLPRAGAFEAGSLFASLEGRADTELSCR